MILWLFDWLLALHPAEVREAFGAEMRRVFLEAREEAWQRGWGPYVRFCGREIFGMMGGLTGAWGTLRYKRLIRMGALAGALVGGGMVWQQATEPYVSTMVLRMTQPRIPESLVAGGGLDAQRAQQTLREVVSRSAVTNIIHSLGLYTRERQRMHIGEVVEQFRRDFQIRGLGNDREESAWELRFAARDPQVAQKVTQELGAQIIEAGMRLEGARAAQTEEFFADMMAAAGRELDAAVTAASEARQQGRATERLELEASLARRQYEAMREKRATAQMLRRVTERKQGARLEVVDSASLPVERWESEYLPWSAGAGALAGAVAGGLAGWVAAWMLSQWPRRRDMDAPVKA